MRPQQIMFLGLIFTTGVMLSLILGGAWLGSTDLTDVNSLTVFRDINVFGLFSMPFPNVSFFLVGLKALTSFDFAFFTGGLELIQWVFFFTIGAATLWGIFSVVIYVASGILRR